MWHLLLAATLAGPVPDAPNAWLAVCPAPDAPGSARELARTVEVSGRVLVLVASEEPVGGQGCVARRLGVPREAVRWARTMSRTTAGQLHRGLILQGVDPDTGRGGEVVPLHDDPLADEAVLEGRDAASAAITRSMWAWQPALWQSTPDDLFARLSRWSATQVYITVPVDRVTGRVEEAERLAAFVARARDAGVSVWAVDGEPEAVLPANRAALVRRVRAYDGFTRSVPERSRLSGIQFDIEPYILEVPGPPEDLNEAYLESVRAARAETSLPIELAVPFWNAAGRMPGGGTLGDALAPLISSVAVMDYRTDRPSLVRFALPWLAWGERHGRFVRIALEAGPMPDLPRRHYRPVPAGELVHLVVGGVDVLVQLIPGFRLGEDRAFSFSHRSSFRGTTLSFHGDTDRLRGLLPELERDLAKYRAFAGLALHEVP